MGLHASNISKNNVAQAKSKVQRKEAEQQVHEKTMANDTAMTHPEGSLQAMHASIQAKLNIGSPGDKYEKEADATADSVMSKPFVQKAAIPEENVQSKTNTVQREEEIQEMTGSEEQVNRETFWSEFHTANEPFVPPPVEVIPSPVEGRSLLTAGKAQETPKAPAEGGVAKGAAKPVATEEKKIQKKEEESPDVSMKEEDSLSRKYFLQTMSEEQNVSPASENEILSKKSFLQMMSEEQQVSPAPKEDKVSEKSFLQMMSEEEVQSKAKDDENLIAPKSFVQTDLFDDKKDVRNDMLNAKEEEVQSKGGGGVAGSSFEGQLKNSKGSGNPMSPDLQSEMSSRFGGKDFSSVKIHNDGNAADMSKQINAKAFTNKSDIYFNSGQFDGNSTKGKTLLAHELTHTIQQGAVPSGENVQASPLDEFMHPEDGNNPEKRVKEDAEEESGEDIDFNKVASAEEKQDARGDIDQEERREQTGKIAGKGIAKPDVDRPGNELPKVKKAAAEGKKKMEEEPEGGGDKKKEPNPPRVDLAPADSMEASALSAYEKADKTKLPKKPKPFKEPRFETPVDKTGEPVPGDPGTDKAVRTLHEISKLLAENAFSLQQEAANDERESWNMRAVLDESFAKVARTKAGSTLAKADKAARMEINSAVEGSYIKNVENVEMVKAEAPKMSAKAAGGKEKAGPMVEEAKEKKREMQEEETEESGQDEKQQQEDTNNVSDGSVEMDNALAGAEAGSDQYLEDAIKGEEKNNQARANLDENKAIDESTQGEIDRIDSENMAAEGQLTEMDMYPDQVQQQTARRAQSGAELYAAAVVMNDQLIDIQNEYYDTMKAEVPGAEEAAKLMAEMQEQQEQAEAEAEAAGPTEEEQMLIEMAGMEEPELDEYLLTMDESQLQNLQGTLDEMTTEEEAEEERDAAGRKKFDLEEALFGKNEEEGPQDPRAMWFGEIENRRGARVGEVKQIADANFVYLSKEQKMMLSQKMAMGDAVSGLFDINILDMGKSMIMGMIDPRESLKGVLNGANQMIGGFVNLFNAEAWKKDPLGNLLQSAADIATGLTTIFMSITGLATVIIIAMGALTIASLGTMSWLTGPVISFMASVISTVGGWTVITGLIALELNALTYIKNLHDAGNAENTDELIFESDSMKQNLTDGFTSLTAVVGGKGSVGGANMMKGNIFKGGLKNIIKNPKSLGKIMKADFKKFIKKAAATGKNIKNFTIGGLKNIKNKIKGAIQKVKNLFKKDKKGPFVQELKTVDGHTLKVRKDGTVVKCSVCGEVDIDDIRIKETLKNNPKNKKALKDLNDDIKKRNLPEQLHHFATNKNKVYTPKMQKIAKKYGLDLDGDWNKQLMNHLGRHPEIYHKFVLQGMNKAALQAGNNAAKFIQLFNKYVREPIVNNPALLRSSGWVK